MSGTLYLCATPIGNMEDITYRVVNTLKEVDIIAAEDTRTSRKLLDRYEITTPMTSYHEHNKIEKAKVLISKLMAGSDIALITDAGTPGISDPGEELVDMCYENEIEVTSLPGAAALITAVTMSGQSCRRFAFEAFLPKDKKYRQHILEELADETRTIILYESPHHLVKTLKELAAALGEDRQLTILRELTKKYEQKVRITFKKALEYYEENEPRGEYVLVIAGKSRDEQIEESRQKWEEITLEEHMEIYTDKGMDRKEAMKAVAKDRGVGKRDIYKALLREEEDEV
ncbi:MAG: 16S rRNA (cytidine(1402)-2'-O)-methyltransferase [Lachnospiraceae bacterium]|nr:16S rRNA (cytidine(1402)-2'-O)-methyltransferase [Lachnospiraceae bacterium]